MRKKQTNPVLIVPAVLLLIGCAARQQPILNSKTVHTDTSFEKFSTEVNDEVAGNAEQKSEPNKETEIRSHPAITIESPSLTDRLLSQVDKEKLKEYEGSYTIDQLRSDEDPGYTVPLYSTWLPDSFGLPETRLYVEYNPETGSYELVGGDLKLPARDLSLSYEKNPSGEDNQTYLIWKKEF